MSNQSYTANSISVLRGLDAVIKRPGMYVGNVTDEEGSGLHHLVYEAIDNSIDEAQNGYCNNIQVTLNNDDSITIEDNGRGIPVDIHPEEGVSACEVIFTVLHAGGKFNNDNYQSAGGLHGVGISVVNALSDWCDVTIKRDGKVHYMRFEEAKPVAPLKVIGKAKSKSDTGTKITFLPRARTFTVTKFNYNTIASRLKSLTYFNKGLVIGITDNRDKSIKQEVFTSKEGLKDFIVEKLKGKPTVFDIVSKEMTVVENGMPIDVSLSLTWTNNYSESIYAYTNSIPQQDGTHVTGLKQGINKVLMKRIKEYVEDKKKRVVPFNANDIREGLLAIVSIKIPEANYSSQTKEKLITTEARNAVDQVVSILLNETIDSNYKMFEVLAKNVFDAARARVRAQEARDQSRSKTPALVSNPTKLASAQSRNPDECELYIVEGDSAGGSAKQGRDKRTQAILPLKGKILNSEKKNISQVLESTEVGNIINALGCGFKQDINLDKLKYHKVIIMTDADDDGMHIETLLLTFFMNYMPELIQAGYLYVACSPLYRVMSGNKAAYFTDKLDLYYHIVSKHKKEFNELHSSLAIIKELIRLGINVTDESKGLSYIEVIALLAYQTTGISFDQFFKERIKIDSSLTYYGQINDVYSFTYNGKLVNFSMNNINGLDANHVTELSQFLINNKLAYSQFEAIFNLLRSLTLSLKLTRFKGLGEMNPEELYVTTMDPNKRVIKQITLNDGIRAAKVKETLMGNKPQARVEFLKTHSNFVE